MSVGEEQWIDDAIKGDQEAFAKVVDLYHKRVFSVCYRMLGSPTAAEDASQETFIKAYQALNRYDPDRSFATWILSIASHYCIDLLRKNKFDFLSLDDEKYSWLAPPAKGPNPEQVILKTEGKDAVQKMLFQLQETDRAAIILQYWHDYSYQEIAQTLDLTESAVKSRLYRARQELAELWTQVQASSTEETAQRSERIVHESPTI